MTVARKGEWVPQNPDAPETIRSYHLSAFTLPFKSGDFGQIAVAFLEAKAEGPAALKAFVYEYLSEEWTEGVEATEESALLTRCADYKLGEHISSADQFADIYVKMPSVVIVTADIQKGYHYALARQWMASGDSGLIEWEKQLELGDLLEFEKRKHRADYVYIDGRYRTTEVCQASAQHAWVPVFGSDRKLAHPFRKRVLDPWEGTAKAGNQAGLIGTYSFIDAIFKQILQDLIRSTTRQAWWIPKGIDSTYTKQVASWELVDGVWQCRRGHSQDHLADTEKMQVLAATIEGWLLSDWLQRLMALAAGIDEEQKQLEDDASSG